MTIRTQAHIERELRDLRLRDTLNDLERDTSGAGTTSTAVPDHDGAPAKDSEPVAPMPIGIFRALVVATLDVAVRRLPFLAALVLDAVVLAVMVRGPPEYDPGEKFAWVLLLGTLVGVAWVLTGPWTEFVERVLTLAQKPMAPAPDPDDASLSAALDAALRDAKREAKAKRK